MKERIGDKRMSGYYGYSMSNNAYDCYRDHIMPLSKWTKDDVLSEIAKVDKTKLESYRKLKLYQLKELLSYDSWHHTSNRFNVTDFYRFDEGKFETYELSYLQGIQKPKKVEAEAERYQATVQVWGGTRSHPRVIGTETVEGVRKGDWLITDNGQRYKLSANKTLEYHKV